MRPNNRRPVLAAAPAASLFATTARANLPPGFEDSPLGA